MNGAENYSAPFLFFGLEFRVYATSPNRLKAELQTEQAVCFPGRTAFVRAALAKSSRRLPL